MFGNISPLLSFSNKQKITLNRNNETLVIGMPDNLIPSSENQMGFVYTNQTTGNPRILGMPSIFRNAQENSIAKYVVASPANQGTYDLRGENVATTIEVGSLSRNASKPRESTVYADANDKIALGEGTTIGEMKQNDDGTVSITLVNQTKGLLHALLKISNIVKVVAKKEDMLKILQNSEGLPEEAKKGLIASLETSVENDNDFKRQEVAGTLDKMFFEYYNEKGTTPERKKEIENYYTKVKKIYRITRENNLFKVEAKPKDRRTIGL
jgi:hypothetical protein